MMPAVCTLRANLPLEKFDGKAKTYSLEVGSYLWASGVWDQIMNDALLYKTKALQAAPQLKVGIHANDAQIWMSLPTI